MSEWERAIEIAQSGRLEEAVAILRPVARDPANLEVRAALSRILQDLAIELACRRDLDHALTLMSEAERLTQADPGLHYSTALILRASGRIPEAIAAYRRSLECQPDHVDALNNLGNLLGALGELDEAIVYLQAAAGARPEDHAVMGNLGNVLALPPSRPTRFGRDGGGLLGGPPVTPPADRPQDPHPGDCDGSHDSIPVRERSQADSQDSSPFITGSV